MRYRALGIWSFDAKEGPADRSASPLEGTPMPPANETPVSPEDEELEWWEKPSSRGSTQGVARKISFRVVGSQGNCRVGANVGTLVTLNGVDGDISPRLCPLAGHALRAAAFWDEISEVDEWCCPVFDHLLVFRREQ